MASERYDLVVFGASGFTGKYVVAEINRIAANNTKPLTWAVAGRNKDRVESALSSVGVSKNVPFIPADVNDDKSLNEMAAKSKVVLNCCGPYRFLGEAVVKACIKNRAHHVDISGEPQYMEEIQLKYSEEAEKAGVYVVSACGLDSIPTDLGVIFLDHAFQGQLNSVEMYIEMNVVGEARNQKSALIHYTTFESAVHGVAAARELPALRRKLFPTRLPPLNPCLTPRGNLHKSDVVNKWCLPFPGSDRSVVQRTQRFLLEKEKKRPVQIYTYCAFPSLFYALLTGFIGLVFGVLSSFDYGRKLLLKHPKFFTFGAISHEGPTEEVANATEFSVTLVGRGWSEPSSEPLDNHATEPDRQVVVRVSGRNPGYGATATALVISALTILRESDKMPGRGGVITPGAAFYATTYPQQLRHFLNAQVLDIKTKDSTGRTNIIPFIHDLLDSGIY